MHTQNRGVRPPQQATDPQPTRRRRSLPAAGLLAALLAAGAVTAGILDRDDDAVPPARQAPTTLVGDQGSVPVFLPLAPSSPEGVHSEDG